MILIIRLDNDRYRNIMFIIILCGDGYYYMWAWVCGSVSRETMRKGRGKGKRGKVGLCVRNVLLPCNIAFPLYQNNIKSLPIHIFLTCFHWFTIIHRIIYIMQ